MALTYVEGFQALICNNENLNYFSYFYLHVKNSINFGFNNSRLFGLFYVLIIPFSSSVSFFGEKVRINKFHLRNHFFFFV
jgi:hypothetical protein